MESTFHLDHRWTLSQATMNNYIHCLGSQIVTFDHYNSQIVMFDHWEHSGETICGLACDHDIVWISKEQYGQRVYCDPWYFIVQRMLKQGEFCPICSQHIDEIIHTLYHG